MSQCFVGQILPVRPIRAFTAQMSRIFGAKVLLFGRSGRFTSSKPKCPEQLA
ncbi:hypothetical protein KI387_003884, partial [Taxus chinensis]